MISIITLFYQRRDLAADFLREWRAVNSGCPLAQTELLLGDCGSTDGTARIIAAAQDIARVSVFDRNLGFARGNNLLAKSATGDLLVFLNNDVAFTPGWLAELVTPFAGRPSLGIVGNIQISVRSGEIDHAGIFFTAEGEPNHFRPTLAALKTAPGLLPVPAVTGACLAIRRSLFLQLDGFHEAYVNGYEDIDLCVRARSAGAEIAVATRSTIWHYICSSPGRQVRESANARLFAQRSQDQARSLARFQPPDLFPATTLAHVDERPIQSHQTLKVYFSWPDGFSEENASLRLYQRGRWSRIEIPLPSIADPNKGVQVRLDPATEPGIATIGGVSLRAPNSCNLLWQAFGSRLNECCQPGGTCSRVPGARKFSIESTGIDPHVTITLPPASLVRDSDAGGLLSVWLRWDDKVFAPTAADNQRAPGSWARRRFRRRVHVLVDLTELSSGGVNGGIKTLTLVLLRHMARHCLLAMRFTVVMRPEVAVETGSRLFPARVVGVDLTDNQAKARYLEGIDVLYAPLGYSRLNRPGLPQMTLIVDVLHRDLPGMLPEAVCAIRERQMAESLGHSDVVQCTSQFVVGRLRHHYGFEQHRTIVVYGALHSAKLRVTVRLPRQPCFFYPANDWPHKNHLRLIEAFRIYRTRSREPWRLRLSGHFQDAGKIRAAIEEHNLNDSIDVVGYVNDREFGMLLRSAGAMIFPSLYEGFGIPIIEAFAADLPVIASRAGSLPEVGGDACGYFDAYDIEAMAAALGKAASDPAWRAGLVALGQKRAGDFSMHEQASRLSQTLLRLGRSCA